MRPALADRRSLIAAAGVRSATIHLSSGYRDEGLLVPLEIAFRCPADPFAVAERGRWVSRGFTDCFATCSAVLANAFGGERLVVFITLVRPVTDFVGVRDFFRCPDLITSS